MARVESPEAKQTDGPMIRRGMGLRLWLAVVLALVCVTISYTTCNDAATPASISTDGERSNSAGGSKAESAQVTAIDATQHRTPLSGPPTANPPLQFEAALAGLTIAVVDDVTQVPIPAARGTVVCFGEPDPWKAARGFTADSQGEATLVTLPPGRVRVSTSEGAVASTVVHAGQSVRLEVRVPQCVSVIGVVRDSLGTSVPGAQIWMTGHGNSTLMQQIAQTDESGRFSFRHLAESRWVAAVHPAYLRSVQHRISAAPGQQQQIEIVFPEGRPSALGGEILCVEGDVPDCQILLSPTPVAGQSTGGFFLNVDRYPIRLDCVESKFRIEGLRPGSYDLQVDAVGHVSEARRVEVREPASLEVVRLSEGQVVQGVVLSEEGRPVPDSAVTLVPLEGPGLYECATDDDGRFRIPGVPVGTADVAVRHPVAGRAAAVVVVPCESVTLDLSRGLRIFGRLESSIPGAAAGVRLGIWRSDSRHELSQSTATTGPEGQFEFGDCEDTSYTLALFAPSVAGRFVRVGKVSDIRPGGGEVVVDLDQFPKPSAWIEGRVVDGFGQTLTAAMLAVGSMDRKATYKLPFRDGRFRLGPLLPGEFLVDVACQGYGKALLDPVVLLPGGTLDLGTVVLTPPGSLRLTTAGGSGGAAASCSLEDRRGRLVARRALTATVDFGSLDSGTYTLTVEVSGQRRVQLVTVHGGDPTVVNLDSAAGN